MPQYRLILESNNPVTLECFRLEAAHTKDVTIALYPAVDLDLYKVIVAMQEELKKVEKRQKQLMHILYELEHNGTNN